MRRGIAASVGAASAKADGGNGLAARPDTQAAEEARELFRGEVPKAKARLVELLESGSEHIALAAANAILDRVFGKPRPAAEPAEQKRPLPPIEFYTTSPQILCLSRKTLPPGLRASSTSSAVCGCLVAAPEGPR